MPQSYFDAMAQNSRPAVTMQWQAVRVEAGSLQPGGFIGKSVQEDRTRSEERLFRRALTAKRQRRPPATQGP